MKASGRQNAFTHFQYWNFMTFSSNLSFTIKVYHLFFIVFLMSIWLWKQVKYKTLNALWRPHLQTFSQGHFYSLELNQKNEIRSLASRFSFVFHKIFSQFTQLALKTVYTLITFSNSYEKCSCLCRQHFKQDHNILFFVCD